MHVVRAHLVRLCLNMNDFYFLVTAVAEQNVLDQSYDSSVNATIEPRTDSSVASSDSYLSETSSEMETYDGIEGVTELFRENRKGK